MLRLKTEFIYNGFWFLRHNRTGMIALYAKQAIHPRTQAVLVDAIQSYEVIRIKIQEANTITVGDKVFEIVEKEVYPRNLDWGTDGFTFNHYEDALNFFNAISKEEENETNSADINSDSSN